MWEDFTVGIEHVRRWKRIALVTDVEWIVNAMKVFGFLVPGEMRLFSLADANQLGQGVRAGYGSRLPGLLAWGGLSSVARPLAEMRQQCLPWMGSASSTQPPLRSARNVAP